MAYVHDDDGQRQESTRYLKRMNPPSFPPSLFHFLHLLGTFKMGIPITWKGQVLQVLPPKRQWPNIPPQIVIHVFSILYCEDAICFALSCKYTLAYYLAIRARFGKTMPVTPRPMFLGVEAIPWARVYLLRRLQNSRWKFCDQCWILHPRSFRDTILPFRRPDHRVCAHGCHALGGSRKCYLPYAGEIGVCPCAILNLHHKLHLISLFHGEALASNCGVQHLPSRNCNCMKMSHACSFDGNPIAHVQINVTFSLGCQDKCLRVQTRLLFDFTKSNPADLEKFWNTRRDLCVRRNTGKWVYRFFHEGKSHFGGGCWNPSPWFSWDVKDNGPLEITMNHNLGRREWPSVSWDHNRCSYVHSIKGY